MKDIAHLRKSYESGELDEAQAGSEPLQQFEQWFQAALDAGVPEPNAMTLATVGPEGRPSTRIVLIKDYDAREDLERLIAAEPAFSVRQPVPLGQVDQA